MEQQDFDPFNVFKRPRDQEEPLAGEQARKRQQQHPASENGQNTAPVDGADASNASGPDALALLETNLIKESIIQPVDMQVESDEQQDRFKLQNFEVEIIKQQEGCLHEVYIPKGYPRKPYTGNFTAKTYKFKLDPFQRKSVQAIESDESVLVCAHTSAGKTAIAEYAIAVSLRNNSRVIYTSPIKALSNQKYRELKSQFKDVGLVTGDVTIDPDSTVLVMTTEILRSMIYRGSEVVREVKWVIFDEVHYMRDKERGVVWEETIIMLPQSVRYVFLSATIGNPGEFAHWITRLKKQPCNVVYTDYRPIPLEHYLCPSGAEAIYMVVDDKGKFMEDNFNKAIQQLGDSVDVVGLGGNKKNKKKPNEGSDLNKLIQLIMQKKFDPVIVFSFSKKDVESHAIAMQRYDFTSKEEKERIRQIFDNAVNILKDEDRKLPQITSIIPMLEKGVGIHHGGLLPLVKEVIEILFQDGLLKILFSTETFSMGLNMPARTVVFTSVRKFDGETNRWLGGGEYIQMSGRAGRRGLDKKGITILMLDEKMEPDVAKNMLKGQSDNLLSSFYINYNMLLNSQRMEDMDPDFIIRRSFLQFQNDAKLPALHKKLNELNTQFQSITLQRENDVERLYHVAQKEEECKEQLRKLTMKPSIALNYLCVGRLLKIKSDGVDWGYGVSINFQARKDKKKDAKNGESAEPLYLVDIMVYIKPRKNNEAPVPCPLAEEGELTVLTFTLPSIYEICTVKISNLPNDLTLSSSKSLVLKTLRGLTQKPIPTIKLGENDPATREKYKVLSKLQEEKLALKEFEPLLPEYSKKRELFEQLKKAAKEIKTNSGMVLKAEKKSLSRVLKRTGLVQKSVVTLKGSVACEISSNHEILLTQLIFSGFFGNMEPIQIASVLSSLVHDEKTAQDKKFVKQEKLRAKIDELTLHAKNMFAIFSQCKLQLTEEQYLQSIKQNLVEVTYAWCHGASFEEVCKMTDCFEGSIIRTLRRLDQLLKQMNEAAKVIGNQDLASRFEEASNKLKRGIVFAASLYL